MKSTFLEKIIDRTRESVTERRLVRPFDELRELASGVRRSRKQHRLRKALGQKDRVNIIAEIKRASPSKGILNENIDVAELAKQYSDGGACAISVLTEEKYFMGSLDDLRTVRKTVDLPILRKDFIIDDYQVFEAAEAGADAILLIVAALTKNQISDFLKVAENEHGLDAVVEVHSAAELIIATDVGASIIGINNRNLHTFDVTIDVSRDLIEKCPKNALVISESGISTRDDIIELRNMGFDGFLIGETLMRHAAPANAIGGLI